jgi:hypothetical protein
VLVRFGGASARRSECDGVKPSAHRPQTGSKPVTVISRGTGARSLKTKTLDCTRRPEHAARHRCPRGESSGSDAKCGMSHRIREKRFPLRALGESKTKGSGTARVVAKSNHGSSLNPNGRWDFVRRDSMGQPRRTHGSTRLSCRTLRRQRTGRVGQRSSSGFIHSRGGLAGFPTGNASRRNVSRKAGEAE